MIVSANIGDQAAKAFGKMLTTNKTLVWLSLSTKKFT